jgi:hypothetical protein
MKNDAAPPLTTRFASTRYSFTLKVRNDRGNLKSPNPIDALRLVWHDYPGDWFEDDVSDPDVTRRRVATFKALLGSDVALLLIDGQRLLDHAGEEERYLRSVFTSFRTGLLRLKDQLLEGGKPLERFPRIWVLALSKADLLPEVDVFDFRDLLISKAADDLGELRRFLQGPVASPEALSVGEDFLLLSSAKFEPNRIEVTERIGVDLILPIASVLPLERYTEWHKWKRLPAKPVDQLLPILRLLAHVLVPKSGKANYLQRLIEVALKREDVYATLLLLFELALDQLRKRYDDALRRGDLIQAVLTGFLIDLKEGEERQILLRSRK